MRFRELTGQVILRSCFGLTRAHRRAGKTEAVAFLRRALEARLLKTLALMATDELDVRPLGPLTHTVTRHRVELTPFEIHEPSGRLERLVEQLGEGVGPGGAVVWLRVKEALQEPLAAPFRKILERSSE